MQPKMVSPFSVNYQQQPSHMANSAKAFAGPQPLPVNVHQPSLNGIQLPNHGRSIVSHQVAGQPKHVQVDDLRYIAKVYTYLNYQNSKTYSQLCYILVPGEKRSLHVSSWESRKSFNNQVHITNSA